MEDEPIRIRRLSAPSDMDTLPQGTIIEVHEDYKLKETYIQRSRDEEHPMWEKI